MSEKFSFPNTSNEHLTTAGEIRPVRHLNQVELARRWNLSPRSLERWRWLRHGPPFLRIGGRVVYRLEDIEAYEAARLHHHEAATDARR